MTGVLVSIIVPVYGTQKYIQKCIDSICMQTYQTLEIILVDDGSKDACPQICDQNAQKDKRIKVIHKKNGGLSSARNAGIGAATGYYISFVDSDDYILPQMIEKLVLRMQTTNSEIGICGMKYVYEDGEECKNVLPCPIIDEVLSKEECFAKLGTNEYFYYIVACNKLYKRELFSNLSFPEGRLFEDEFVMHRIIAESRSVSCIEDKLYLYVQHKNSITNSKITISRLDAAWALYDRYIFFRERHYRLLAEKSLYLSCHVVMKCMEQLNLFKYRIEFCEIFKAHVFSLFFCPRLVIKLLPDFIHMLLEIGSKWKNEFLIWFKLWFLKKENIKRYILLATPTHGNLGDQAIVLAEKEILAKLKNRKQIVEIPNEIYLKFGDLIQKYCNQNDVIIIDGGGNLGTLWKHEDDKISDIIERFHNNKIIIFPQTCYYDRKELDFERIVRNRECYNNASELTIFLRDINSINFFKEFFPKVKIFFLPDIVLSTQPVQLGRKRNGILLCLRNDCEKKHNSMDESVIQKILLNKNLTWKNSTMIAKKSIGKKNRKKEVQKKFDEFSRAKLIITDRLHAMIFAAVTGTPCIAFDNKSGKVKGTYEIIQNLAYISFVNNEEEMEEKISRAYDCEEHIFDFVYPRKELTDILEGKRNYDL